jgi:hypothetical protein
LNFRGGSDDIGFCFLYRSVPCKKRADASGIHDSSDPIHPFVSMERSHLRVVRLRYSAFKKLIGLSGETCGLFKLRVSELSICVRQPPFCVSLTLQSAKSQA